MQTPPSDRIERILTSLDKVQRVPAPPYFYTRLLARLDSSKPLEQGLMLWLRPIPVVSLLIVLLLLNFWLINTPAATPTATATTIKSESEDELHILAFEERSAEHSVTEYEMANDPFQK